MNKAQVIYLNGMKYNDEKKLVNKYMYCMCVGSFTCLIIGVVCFFVHFLWNDLHVFH